MSSRAAKKRAYRAAQAKNLKEAFAPMIESLLRQMDEPPRFADIMTTTPGYRATITGVNFETKTVTIAVDE